MLKNNLIEKLLFGRAAENVKKRKYYTLVLEVKIRHLLLSTTEPPTLSF
jgi:hypothetical protein